MKNNTEITTSTKKQSKLVRFLKSRNAKRGAISIILTILFIAVIVGLNIVAKSLTANFPILSYDLTPNSIYELTDTSLEYISTLEKDVTIYVLAEEQTLEDQGEYYLQVNKLLHEFESNSKHIKLKYIDLSTNPSFAQAYPDVNWSAEPYLMLIEYKEDHVAVSQQDVFTYDEEYLAYGQYYINGQKCEQAVLTAIFNITAEEKIGVTILTGHGELENTALNSLLFNNAYDVETVSLLNGEISKDSQFVVIFAPENDIDKDTYNTLVDWLYNNGEYGHTLLYVPNDMATQETPNIDMLLEEWSMSVNKGWIYETDPSYMTNSAAPNLISIFNYEDNEFTNGLKDTSIPVVMMYCMPVELHDSSVISLLSSSEKAVVRPLSADENWNENDEEATTLCGAAISSQGNEDNSKKSNVIVIGSYEALSEGAFSTTSFNNSNYIVNLFNTISHRDDITLTIEGKSIESSELGITSLGTATVLGFVFYIIIPLAVAIVGIVMWIRRRHR